MIEKNSGGGGGGRHIENHDAIIICAGPGKRHQLARRAVGYSLLLSETPINAWRLLLRLEKRAPG